MTTTTSNVLNAKAPALPPAPIAARPPRYARVTRAVNVCLTEDDQCIMREVYMHRFLRSTHIAKLLPSKGSKNLQHRLRLLYDAGYLDRIREDAPAGENPPMVYALGNRGAEGLGIRQPGVNWSDKNRVYGSRQLKHALLLTEITVAIRRSCFIHEFRFIPPKEILDNAPESTQQLPRPLQWKVSVQRPGTQAARETVRPDYIFGIEFPNHPQRPGAQRFYMLEVDRGTEPQRRTEPRGRYEFRRLESIADKLFLYNQTFAAWKGGREVRPYNFTNFFVLVVTDCGPRRIANMVKESMRISCGVGVHTHRFADLAAIENNDILTMQWLTGEGKSLASVEWLMEKPRVV